MHARWFEKSEKFDLKWTISCSVGMLGVACRFLLSLDLTGGSER